MPGNNKQIEQFDKEYVAVKNTSHLRNGKNDLNIVTGEGDPRNSISLNSRA
jgi:hypothetical protein